MSEKPAPRLRLPDRSVVVPRCTLDDLVPQDHPVRLIWDYVEEIDVSALHEKIRAVAGKPGRPMTDPRVLLALWMLAVTEGVGSARELAKLCLHDNAYRWLCGSLSINHHTLSDFRKDHNEQLEKLLVTHVTALLHAQVITLQRVSQDGMKVRANAAADSFRTQESIQQAQQQVEEQLQWLKEHQKDSNDPTSGQPNAARQRHLQERTKRLQKALQVAEEIETKRQERADKDAREAARREKDSENYKGRASTTDPDARKMKMPDGGFRAAYNVQFATTAQGIIAAVDVTEQGNDVGQMGPMLDQIRDHYDQDPKEYLVDCGFAHDDDVQKAHDQNTTVFMPLKKEKQDLKAGKNPYEPKKGDNEAMKELRARMGTREANETLAQRGQSAEWVNAGMRQRKMYQVPLRGKEKVRGLALWQALVHNFWTSCRLIETQLQTWFCALVLDCQLT